MKIQQWKYKELEGVDVDLNCGAQIENKSRKPSLSDKQARVSRSEVALAGLARPAGFRATELMPEASLKC